MLGSRGNRQRGLIALVQVLSLSVWFSASAVVPTLRLEWGMTSAEAVWLTASVQIGFVVGAIVSSLTNLADRMAPHLLLALSGFCAAACTGVLALVVHTVSSAIPLRFLTGLFLAGIYPVGMKLMVSWSPSARRGMAFGLLLGALTLGSALPHLISGLGFLKWEYVMGTAAIISGTGALMALLGVRQGPYLNANPVRLKPKHLLEIFRDRGSRLVNLGYFGHMWELYALWTWLPSFIMASQGSEAESRDSGIGLWLFAAIGIAGVAGCLFGGWASDRFGRAPTAVAALAVSGTCCLVSPVMFSAPWPTMLAFTLIWGASAIADSGVFSTALSEISDSRYLGTALTAQTAIGFFVTVITIQIVPMLADLLGWKYAFLLLAVGPVVGAVSMHALNRKGNLEARTHIPARHTGPQTHMDRRAKDVLPLGGGSNGNDS